MTTAEVFERMLWGEVEAELLHAYPDAEAQLPDYERVFRSLLYLTPIESKFQIAITEATRKGELADISGRDAETDDCEDYALDFQPWDEWLGMRVSDTNLHALTLPRIAAHCLYEMTFWGFSEAEVVAARRDLIERIEKMKGSKLEERDLYLPLTRLMREVQEEDEL